MLPEAVWFDCDGTLVDVTGIRRLINGPGGYDAFHRASIDCPPNGWVLDAAREQHDLGRAVLIVTARPALYRNITAFWLAMHGVPSEAMWMRAARDQRPDVVVKREILAKIRQRYRLVHAWDDNPVVIEMLESEGVPVTVVPGWFEAVVAAEYPVRRPAQAN